MHLRPIYSDAFLQRSPEKFAKKHVQNGTHQSKSVRHVEKFAGRIVEVISTFRRANLLVVNTSQWNFTMFIHINLTEAFIEALTTACGTLAAQTIKTG